MTRPATKAHGTAVGPPANQYGTVFTAPAPTSHPTRRRAVTAAIALAVLPFMAAAPATRPATAEDLFRARQRAVIEYRSTPAYAAAARAVQVAHDAYADRRDGLMVAVEQHDPRYATWKRGLADADAEVARAGRNPATTPEPFEQLLAQRAEFARQLQATEDDVVTRDADANHLRQQWLDACGKLDAIRNQMPAVIAADPAVRSAEAAGGPGVSAVDLVRRYPSTDPAADPTDVVPPRR